MSNRTLFIIVTAAVAAMLWGCERAGSGASTEDERSAETAEPEKAASGGHGARHERGHGEGDHPEHGECDDGSSGEGCEEREEAPPVQVPLKAPVSLGATAAEGVEVVDAAAVVADPAQYRGKTISVSGTVKGFCHHGRSWYAIDVPGASPPYLRILSRPAFSVPDGVMGATVVTHGTVDVQELPRGRAEHFEQEHALGTVEGDSESETVTRAVFRAAGAVFSPAAAPAEEATD